MGSLPGPAGKVAAHPKSAFCALACHAWHMFAEPLSQLGTMLSDSDCLKAVPKTMQDVSHTASGKRHVRHVKSLWYTMSLLNELGTSFRRADICACLCSKSMSCRLRDSHFPMAS